MPLAAISIQGDKSQQDGGLAYVCRDAGGDCVCLGLLDVKRMGRPRRGGMGSLHMYVETHEKLVCLGLLDVNDGATKARRDG